jgi:tetratricopeptide (TPR) repeat protein
MYTPAVGLYVLAALALGKLHNRYFAHKSGLFKKGIYALVVFILISYSIMTYDRLDVWHDDITFWEDTVQKSPAQYKPHVHLGAAYEKKGRLHEAEREYLAAMAIFPNEDALYNLRILREKIRIFSK